MPRPFAFIRIDVSRTIFITGTDTGAGKTALAALLLHHLRQQGRNALALKPFCSGGRADARLLLALQKGAIELDEVNPFYFPKPLAPWVASPGPQTRSQRPPSLQNVLRRIERVKQRCDILLIEGSGGLFVPLGPDLFVLDLIEKTADSVLVAARNALGVINQAMLTVGALKSRGVRDISVVLTGQPKPDISVRTNRATLEHFLSPIPVVELPFLEGNLSTPAGIRRHAPSLNEILDQLSANQLPTEFQR